MQEDQVMIPPNAFEERGRRRPGGLVQRGRTYAAPEEADLSVRLTYFAIGGAVGALVALLFAPKSGHELRGDIADVTRKGAVRTRDAAQQIGTKAGEYYEVTREKAGELAETAREAAASRGEQLSAAIEAGKQAYSEEKRRTRDPDLLDLETDYDEGRKRLS